MLAAHGRTLNDHLNLSCLGCHSITDPYSVCSAYQAPFASSALCCHCCVCIHARSQHALAQRESAGLDLASKNMWWELQDAKEKAGEAAVRVCLFIP